MTETTTTEPVVQNWLSTKQAARYTGLSESFFYHNYERIPHTRIKGNGGKSRGIIRFARTDLDAWMRTGGK